MEKSKTAFATAIGSIEQDLFSEEKEYGFYASEDEPWITVLCKDCGSAVHDFITGQLQVKYL
ncbi:MAG: hypothetical protein L6246_02390 [Thermodesulfovibrionales bacterium]|nr:hypothetical protein [Thermodesulfovibrionales bacterium]